MPVFFAIIISLPPRLTSLPLFSRQQELRIQIWFGGIMKFIHVLFILLPLISILKAGSSDLFIKVIKYPEDTPFNPDIYLAANINNWDPAHPEYKLEKKDAYYQLQLNLGNISILEYKFPRGSWETVEKGGNGEEIANRTYNNLSKIDTLNITIANWRDLSDPELKRPSTINGNVIYLESFFIPQLNRYRTIRLYLPPEYETSGKNYPVLYMHDGQNLFDEATSFAGEWKVDETLNNLFNENRMNGIIVVGIDNDSSKRFDEYSPWRNDQYNAGSEGQAYIDFIVNTLKPWIDKNYRTLTGSENTAIAGSSMGGLISLYAGCKYPSVFSRLGIFSPAFWFAKDEMVAFIRSYPLSQNSRGYIDVGTEEGNDNHQKKAYLHDAEEIYQLLIDTGIPQNNINLIIDKGAKHNEVFWANRFPAACLWLWQ